MKTATVTSISGRSLHAQRGASLLEGIAYLGIAALVILGAIALLSSAFGTAQSNRSNQEVVSLRTASKKLYSGQVYPASMVPALISSKSVPGTLIINTTSSTITNSYGGGVTIVGNAGAGGTNNFTITYNAVPQDACIAMLSGASDWTQITVGSTSITTFPVTTAQATTACSAAANVIAMTST